MPLCASIHLQSFIMHSIRAVTDSVYGEDTEDHYSLQSTSVYWCLQCWFVGVQKNLKYSLQMNTTLWLRRTKSSLFECCPPCKSCYKKKAFTRIKASFMTYSRFIAFLVKSNMYSCRTDRATQDLRQKHHINVTLSRFRLCKTYCHGRAGL